MASKFEDIEVWQLARGLVKEIYSLTNQEKIKRNYSLSDQIQRAALSEKKHSLSPNLLLDLLFT